MKKRQKLTQEYIKSIFDYDPKTGVLKWKSRCDVLKEWNTCHAGRNFGTKNTDGYIMGTLNYENFYAHRLIWLYMTGKFEKEIDHEDTDKANNKWKNLRKAIGNQNKFNRPKQRNNKSGYKSVHFRKDTAKWVAKIQVNKKVINLGCFSTPEEAHLAYCAAMKDYHGEFARAV